MKPRFAIQLLAFVAIIGLIPVRVSGGDGEEESASGSSRPCGEIVIGLVGVQYYEMWNECKICCESNEYVNAFLRDTITNKKSAFCYCEKKLSLDVLLEFNDCYSSCLRESSRNGIFMYENDGSVKCLCVPLNDGEYYLEAGDKGEQTAGGSSNENPGSAQTSHRRQPSCNSCRILK